MAAKKIGLSHATIHNVHCCESFRYLIGSRMQRSLSNLARAFVSPVYVKIEASKLIPYFLLKN
jgi:hypothetical protein